jgi:hypothetical protein
MSDPADHEREREEGADRDPQPGVGDAPMRAAIMSVFFCALIFAVIGFAFFGPKEGLGVLIGGLIAAANLWVFARVGQAFVSRRGNAAPWAVIAVLKMILLFGGVWLLVKSGLVSGLSLAAGYSAMPFGITFASLFGPKPSESDLDSTTSAHRGRDVIKGPRTGRGDPDRDA